MIKMPTSLAALVFIACLSASTCLFSQQNSCSFVAPEQYFCDDFTDEDAGDGSPISWMPVYGANLFVDQTDSLRVVGDGIVGASTGSGNRYSDTSVRARVRLESGQIIGISSRWDPSRPGEQGYYASVSQGMAYFGTTGNGGRTFATTAIPFGPTDQDVFIQLDVIEDQVSMFAWPADEPMPESPLMTSVDQALPDGQVFLWTGNPSLTGPIDGAYRFVQAAAVSIPVPEPSPATLCLFGLFGFGVWRRRIC